MEKYLDLLREAKRKNETLNIHEFLKKCKEESELDPPSVMKYVLKNGLSDVLTLK